MSHPDHFHDHAPLSEDFPELSTGVPTEPRRTSAYENQIDLTLARYISSVWTSEKYTITVDLENRSLPDELTRVAEGLLRFAPSPDHFEAELRSNGFRATFHRGDNQKIPPHQDEMNFSAASSVQKHAALPGHVDRVVRSAVSHFIAQSDE